MKSLVLLFTFVLTGLIATAQSVAEPTTITYKTIDTTRLQLRIFKPADFAPTKQYPAVIFFFGGGWINGNIKQFQKQAEYLATRGLVTLLADYRVASRHKTTPFEAVADGKSAIRYLRSHAAELNIDPKRIAAAGGSAGGHIAAASELTKLDDASEDLSISSRPNALILFNPVFNNGPGQYGYERVGDRYQQISPYHNIVAGAAPTTVFLGTSDKLVSVATAEAYQQKMIAAGSRCDLHLYKDKPHGFFNNGESFSETLRETDIFLESLGYITGKPTL